MSQWGAKGLADLGWSTGSILGLFYPGTRVEKRPGPVADGSADTIRVGLAQRNVVVEVNGTGAFDFVHQGRVVATAPGGEWWQIAWDGTYSVRRPGGAEIWRGGDGGEPVVVDYERFGVIVKLNQTGHRYRYGRLEVDAYDTDEGQRLRTIGVMPFERYLYGLGEMPSSWPAEALRAQAIAARTYALEKAGRAGQHRTGCDCALYASTLDQAYIGHEKEAASGGDRWVSAVNDTAGQVVVFRNDAGNWAPIQAYYSASDGGATEANELVWGGAPLPYLRAMCDPGDWAGGANPHNSWEVKFTEPDLRARLASGGVDVGVVQRVELVPPQGVSGRSTTVQAPDAGGVRVTGTLGSARLSGDRFRSLLGLKSTLIGWPIYGGIRGRWNDLWCQPGPAHGPERDWTYLDGAPAGRAQDFAVGRLLWNRRSGEVFWTYGGILGKYDALRASGFDPGLPTSDEHDVAGGRASNFEGARIYWTPRTDAQVVYGGILGTYLRLGGPAAYGFPVTDEIDAPGGRMSRFEAGALVWNRSSSAVLRIYGGILGRWLTLQDGLGQPRDEEHDDRALDGRWRGRAQNFDGGRLVWAGSTTGRVWWVMGGILGKDEALRASGVDIGLPTSDEYSVAGGRATNFEGGRIYWTSRAGAWVVYGGILGRYLDLGGPASQLGFPISDEYAVPGGRRSDFEGGTITWSPSAGTNVSYR